MRWLTSKELNYITINQYEMIKINIYIFDNSGVRTGLQWQLRASYGWHTYEIILVIHISFLEMDFLPHNILQSHNPPPPPHLPEQQSASLTQPCTQWRYIGYQFYWRDKTIVSAHLAYGTTFSTLYLYQMSRNTSWQYTQCHASRLA